MKNGDPIRIDARSEARTIDLLISDEEWEKRRQEWTAPPLRTTQGTLFKYVQCVATASEGCVTDEVIGAPEPSRPRPRRQLLQNWRPRLLNLKGVLPRDIVSISI